MKSMLICTDLGPYSKTTVIQGLNWAHHYDLRPIIIHIKPQPEYNSEGVEDRLSATTSARHHIEENYLENYQYETPQIEVWYGDIVDCLQMAISKHKSNYLAIGLKSHSLLKDVFMGNTTHKLLSLLPTNIICIHDEQQSLPTNLLLACESLDLNSLPLKKLSDLQVNTNQMTHILHVINNQTVANDLKDQTLNNITSLEEMVSKAKSVTNKKLKILEEYYKQPSEYHIIHSEDKSSGEFILDFAQKNHNDIIALANHTDDSVSSLYLGSTAEYLIKNSNLSLIIYKQGLN